MSADLFLKQASAAVQLVNVLMTGDVIAESVRPVDGYLPVPLTPPMPDPELLATFSMTGERAAWWRARLKRVSDGVS